MTVPVRRIVMTALIMWIGAAAVASETDKGTADRKGPTRAAAQRMIRAAEGSLSPVYAPLAEEIAARLDLADEQGIGIDLGSGPGTLIVELCKRTQMHWINADINPHFFPYFFDRADAEGCGELASQEGAPRFDWFQALAGEAIDGKWSTSENQARGPEAGGVPL